MIKKRLVNIMKRWWLIALVFTLALSLTSCASGGNEDLQDNNGYVQCDGTLGSFDVWVIPDPSRPGLYALSVIPIQPSDPGDIISVTVANRSLAYRTLVQEVAANPNQEIFAGYITDSDLNTFELVALTPYQPGLSFLEVNAEKDAICELPFPYQTSFSSPYTF